MNNLHFPEPWLEPLGKAYCEEVLGEISANITPIFERNISVFPPLLKMFRALEMVNFNDAKILILGQDPYHGLGQANGLAFSVDSKLKIPFSNIPNEYCETQYIYNDRDDGMCIRNAFDNPVEEGPKGPLEGAELGLQCKLVEADFSQDTHCPFQMATTELQDFDEMDQRIPVQAWQWAYDEIFEGGERISEPEHLAWQNENRYLIVNQNYGSPAHSLFN